MKDPSARRSHPSKIPSQLSVHPSPCTKDSSARAKDLSEPVVGRSSAVRACPVPSDSPPIPLDLPHSLRRKCGGR
uniref:Uncharacterized protein n=1 Tax=Cannabis sativa TaxID=3483 RepID=A0A803QPZ7_CANSA